MDSSPQRRLADVLRRAVAWFEQAVLRDPAAVRAIERHHRIGDGRAFLDRVTCDEAFAHLDPEGGPELGRQLAELTARLGAPLPPSLRTLWIARAAHPGAREIIDALWLGWFHEPAHYLDLPAWAAPARLSVVGAPVGFGGAQRASWADARELMAGEYPAWFASSGPEFLFPTPDAWRTWPIDRELGVRLPPQLASSLVDLARWDDNHGFAFVASRSLVSDWRDERQESPVFAIEESGGFAWKRGDDVIDFLDNELAYRIANFDDELRDGGQRLRG